MMIRRLSLALILLTCAACGGSNGPTGPTGQPVIDAAGVWAYVATMTSVTGGECVGALLQPSIGSVDRGTLSVTQTGATLTATSRSNSGGSCTYTGTAGSSAIALGWQTCDSLNIGGIQCSNGTRRDMILATNTINATVNGNTASGTQGQGFNIFIAGTGSGVGILNTGFTFTASR